MWIGSTENSAGEALTSGGTFKSGFVFGGSDAGTTITGNTYICADEKVTIGDNVLIAEFCTIRDSDHGIAADRLICDQPGTSLPVTIGSDVWIGAGCAILKGATVPDGCVIGAHSVVLRNSKLVPGGIYAGTPVRLIRMRAPETPQK